MICMECGSSEDIRLEDSRTNYEPKPVTLWHHIREELPPDPNAPVALCRDCAADHHAYWDERWDEWYRVQG